MRWCHVFWLFCARMVCPVQEFITGKKKKRINVLKQTSHYCEASAVRVTVTYFGWGHKHMRTFNFAGCYAGRLQRTDPCTRTKWVACDWRYLDDLISGQRRSPMSDSALPHRIMSRQMVCTTTHLHSLRRIELWHSHSSWVAHKIGFVTTKEEKYYCQFVYIPN